MKLFGIGEVSKVTDLSVDTLRYYEREKLITVEKRVNNIRKFSHSDVEAIQFIKCLKSMGMEIKEIKEYIDLEQQGNHTLNQRIEILENVVLKVDQRSANLKRFIIGLREK